MTTWKPGQLAMLTLRTGVEKPALRVEPDGEEGWVWQLLGEEFPGVAESGVTAARRLFLVDPENDEQVKRLAEAYDNVLRRAFPDAYDDWDSISEDEDDALMRDALRSLIAAPKPEEPTGQYAVVFDGAVCWVRAAWANPNPWNKIGTDTWADYADIDAVRVLSQGVTP